MALAQPIVRAVLRFPAKSGIARDAAQVTLHFRPPGGEIPVDGGSGTVIIDALVAAFDKFLNVAPAGILSTMGGILAQSVSRVSGAVELQLYAVPLAQALLGVPFSVRHLTISGQDSFNSFPAEVAATLTYHADLTNIPERGVDGSRPASQRRGRFYWGPLTSNIGQTDPDTGRLTIGTVGRNLMVNASADNLFGQADAANWRWVVFSRKLWNAFDVAAVWADDAWDTQRRRGEDATLRTTRVF